MKTVISDLLVEHVSIKPDRFGRQHPWLHLINESQVQDDIFQVPLRTIDDLYRYDCFDGDVVDLVLSNKVVTGVEKKYPSTRHVAEIDYDLEMIKNGQCCCCKMPGIIHNDALYCINQVCTECNLQRSLYACSPKALDIPLHAWDIQALQMKIGPQSTTPVADLLNGINRDELVDIKYDDELDEVLKVINRRSQQLHGIGHPPYVQNVIQGRHLASLSLRGLFKTHINKLLKALMQGCWTWSELPLLLTDMSQLHDLGIPPRDAKTITDAAQERYEEITAFSAL